jgi:nitroreductase
MSKRADTDHPISEAQADRWSPYGFSGREIPVANLRSLLEASRWSASAFNEQPWRYIVARKTDGSHYEQVLSCLVEANQAWAEAAPVLILTVAAENYARNEKPNGNALHDCGQASANLSTEAAHRGLSVHQMAGILPDRARELFGIPESFRAITGMAIGYAADPASLPDELRQRDTAPRTRRPQSEFVFSGSWGQAALWED